MSQRLGGREFLGAVNMASGDWGDTEMYIDMVHFPVVALTCPHVLSLQRLCSIAEPLHPSTVCVWGVPLLR